MNYKSKMDKYGLEMQALLGETIRTVAYCEIDMGEPQFDFGNYHSVDHGVQFQMSNGKKYYFMWAAQYHSFDLKFGLGSIIDQFPKDYPPPVRSLTHHEKWVPLIGHEVVNIKSYWPYINYQNSEAEKRCPQDVKLTLSNGENLIFSTIEVAEGNTIVPMADNISVFFDVDTAIRYGICKEVF